MASSPNHDHAAEQEARPVPPRYWWLKRIGPAAGVFVLALVGLRLWWGHEAERRLQAKIAEYYAAGEPVLLEDLAPEAIPDEENGAYFLQKAAALLSQPIDASEVVWDLRHGQLDPTVARKSLADNAEVLRLVREARSKPAADWKVSFSTPGVNVLLPYLSSQRALAKAVYSAATYQHLLGNDAAALELVRDGIGIGRHVDGGPAMVISHLVAVAIDGLGCLTLEAIVPDLRFADGTSSAPADARPATREQVQVLIDELSDESGLQAGWVLAMRSERMMELDTIQALCNGRVSVSGLANMTPPSAAWLVDRPVGALLGPAWKLDALRMMANCDALALAGTAPNWPTAQQRLPPNSVPSTAAQHVSRIASTILMPSLERAVLIQFRDCAQRRTAAVALALRLYESDNERRPASLADLVPDYLPAIPRDPFDVQDGPIRYLPEAHSPLLYSVGSNGVDDGGRVVLKGSGGVDYDAGDQPFFLNGDRPMPAPQRDQTGAPPQSQPASTQTVVDDQQVEDAERPQN